MKFKDLTNKKFGKLIVIKRSEKKSKKVYWDCLCDCGNIKSIASCHLLSGSIKDCGCLKKERISKLNYKHGESTTKLYRTYNHMKDRCYRETDTHYKNYGGRGIKICDEWLGENGYLNFSKWAKTNGYDEKFSIDRINVNGNYEPSNCRWVGIKKQSNNKTNNHYLYYNGQKYTLTELANKFNIKQETLRKRLKLGWKLEDALRRKI